MSQVYYIQVVAAVIGFFDIFALGFMQSFVTLFVSEEFGVNLLDATFWMGLATLFKQFSYAFSSPIWGWLSDRVGSKKMLIRVMAGHSLAHFLMFTSRNTYEFTAFLCLDGVLGSMSTPVFALISKTVDQEKLPQVLSYQQSIQTVGSLLAPGVGGILALELGYRPTYLLASLIFASLVLLVLVFRYHEPLPSRDQNETSKQTAKSSESYSFREELMEYSRFIGLDFIGLLITYASVAFINPIKPLCLESLGITDKAELLYYISLLATLSSLAYMIANPIGTRFVKRSRLPLLSLIAGVLAFTQSSFQTLTLFFILSIGIRAIQAPIQSHLLGGSGRKKRTGTHIGILQSGRYIGSAIGPFMASTLATTIGLPTTFITLAVLQLFTSLFLFIQNKRLEKRSVASP